MTFLTLMIVYIILYTTLCFVVKLLGKDKLYDFLVSTSLVWYFIYGFVVAVYCVGLKLS